MAITFIPDLDKVFVDSTGKEYKIHGKEVKSITCRKCKTVSYFHVPPLTWQGWTLPELCWTCEYQNMYGPCWCEWCKEKASSLCKKCGFGFAGGQCECKSEVPTIKKESSKKRKIEEESDKKLTVDLHGTIEEETIKPSEFFSGYPIRKEHPELSDKAWLELVLDWGKFVLVCKAGKPTGLSLKAQNKLQKIICDSIKNGKERATFILFRRGDEPLFGYSDK